MVSLLLVIMCEVHRKIFYILEDFFFFLFFKEKQLLIQFP